MFRIYIFVYSMQVIKFATNAENVTDSGYGNYITPIEYCLLFLKKSSCDS